MSVGTFGSPASPISFLTPLGRPKGCQTRHPTQGVLTAARGPRHHGKVIFPQLWMQRSFDKVFLRSSPPGCPLPDLQGQRLILAMLRLLPSSKPSSLPQGAGKREPLPRGLPVVPTHVPSTQSPYGRATGAAGAQLGESPALGWPSSCGGDIPTKHPWPGLGSGNVASLAARSPDTAGRGARRAPVRPHPHQPAGCSATGQPSGLSLQGQVWVPQPLLQGLAAPMPAAGRDGCCWVQCGSAVSKGSWAMLGCRCPDTPADRCRALPTHGDQQPAEGSRWSQPSHCSLGRGCPESSPNPTLIPPLFSWVLLHHLLQPTSCPLSGCAAPAMPVLVSPCQRGGCRSPSPPTPRSEQCNFSTDCKPLGEGPCPRTLPTSVEKRGVGENKLQFSTT